MKVFPEDLLYSREHVWVRVDGYMATMGITDFAQESLGEILSVEFTDIDDYVERDEPFGSIESAKAVVDLISPVSGTVVSINEDINDDIGIINSDPHDTGWLIVVEMDNLDQLDDLLVASAYHDFISQEEQGV
ncbi:MAG TPA: glycine cleavage system protein GcvH [Smithellaceae bacterium]|jgi:glycine cleavage system H protein|nr:glycine cleavage system protein GcvH [Syntrophaceae bacterium]NMD04478.1 glycine cleavage system protein GcvH [Deltaproteobacteria bacterium]OPZ53274.1 MAG: Glycine cleavage system H protein [Deltaproteobacteria bacterium ADurb.BinA014]HNQ17528.1 glycine cleavage system protein GcvH [Smithellaceae bacterium]MBP8608823.1 glycine cleavage system protein GcvH [Syntrophaceae bacterium]